MPRRTDRVEASAVHAVVGPAAAADGVPPLSEQALLALTGPGPHLLAEEGGDLLGYATPGDGTGELVVTPDARRRGLGRQLLDALLTEVDAAWAHGDLAPARALAAAAGLRRTRVLWQLRRDLSTLRVPEARWPDGVTVRTFAPGRDEDAWLALNAAAFAHHPEQGRWTSADLAAREAEPWFDPSGFFLAERDGEVVGSHWTKVAAGQGEALGEVYVVGVDPAAAGGGLGRALTLHGLHHLADRGLHTAVLYVDEDNPRALTMYEHLGFRRYRADVTYARD